MNSKKNSNASPTVYVYRGKPDLSVLKIFPGDWVVIKPNLVKQHKENDAKEWKSVITDGELIRDVTEYVCQQLHGKGRVTICDAPQTDSSFAVIRKLLRLDELALECADRYAIQVEVLDLRNEEWLSQGEIIVKREKLSGDPHGTIRFNLGKESLFFGHSGEGRYYGADYDAGEVNRHHHGELQEYLICATPIRADVFINLPKLKTHKKTGVTLNLKNLVGINADKNWLPHHTEAGSGKPGDEYPQATAWRLVEQKLVKITRQLALRIPILGPWAARAFRRLGKVIFGDGSKALRSGNWHGNDTTWRMVLDLNRCLLFGTPDGTLDYTQRKRYYSVLDGRIGMEGDGPMKGDPVASDLVIVGTDPVCVDVVASRIMGYDWRKIPVIREAFSFHKHPLTPFRPEQIQVEGDIPEWKGDFPQAEEKTFLFFKPHIGWRGHIEYSSRF